jgi:hypothetical protein
MMNNFETLQRKLIDKARSSNGSGMVQRLQAAVHRHEQREVAQTREDTLDLSNMTLEDLQREHLAVSIRLKQNLLAPEGKELLEERHDTLLRKIKLIRRLK